MKDFVISEVQLDFAVSLGADAVLLIVRALSESELPSLAEAARRRGLAIVAEAHTEAEIRRAAAVEPDVVGVNARDLSSFRTDLGAVEALARAMPAGAVPMAESGIRERADVDRLSAAGYRAFLVGEALLRSEDPEDDLRALTR